MTEVLTIDTSNQIRQIVANLYAQGSNAGVSILNFAPEGTDSFFPYTVTSTMNLFASTFAVENSEDIYVGPVRYPALNMRFSTTTISTLGYPANPFFPSRMDGYPSTMVLSTPVDRIKSYLSQNTNIPQISSLYNIFISSAGPNAGSLINSLPLYISSTKLYANCNVCTITYMNMNSYISNWFQSHQFPTINTETEKSPGFTITGVNTLYKTLGDFATVKLYNQKISTYIFQSTITGVSVQASNTFYYGEIGSFLQGGNQVSAVVAGRFGRGGGGGGGGYYGGDAGAYTDRVLPYTIGGGGGGGGSSFVDLTNLQAVLNSKDGFGVSTGYCNYTLVTQCNIGKGGVDSNAYVNWISSYTYPNYANGSSAVENGGNGLVVLTEFIDPFKITISTATNYFVPFRIDANTNELVVNKLVISSTQLLTGGPDGVGQSPSTLFLDFGNYQHIYIQISTNNSQPAHIHLIPLSTISSPTMNFQNGLITIRTDNFGPGNNTLIEMSTFKIDTRWQPSTGILYPQGYNTYIFDYFINNSNIYLGQNNVF